MAKSADHCGLARYVVSWYHLQRIEYVDACAGEVIQPYMPAGEDAEKASDSKGDMLESTKQTLRDTRDKVIDRTPLLGRDSRSMRQIREQLRYVQCDGGERPLGG